MILQHSKGGENAPSMASAALVSICGGDHNVNADRRIRSLLLLEGIPGRVAALASGKQRGVSFHSPQFFKNFFFIIRR